jgi:HD superfamily phosphohydrolase
MSQRFELPVVGREIRDPIHGFIERSDVESSLIDTPTFQRLRAIRQLAMAQLVYPGANHTRFDHSLGVMHIAGRMAERLDLDSERKRCIRLAGLLHDLGHGPFSHVSEDVLSRHYVKSAIAIGEKGKIHEAISCGLIEYAKDIRGILSDKDRVDIVGIIRGDHGQPIERNIISGPMDADKQDYLLRDSYFCGVRYGVYDLERLLQTIGVLSFKGDQYLAIAAEGVNSIEQFVLARYYMGRQVYGHKIRLITDSMIIRALNVGILQDKLKQLIRLYVYDGSESYLRNYLTWDDARLTHYLIYHVPSKAKSRELFIRLRERHLYKIAFSEIVDQASFKDPVVRGSIGTIIDDEEFHTYVQPFLAQKISELCRRVISPHEVIVNSYTINSVRKKPVGTEGSEGSILVGSKGVDGTPKKLEDVSMLFRSISAGGSERHLEVYAPVVYPDESRKAGFREEMQGEVGGMLKKMIKSYGQRSRERLGAKTLLRGTRKGRP